MIETERRVRPFTAVLGWASLVLAIIFAVVCFTGGDWVSWGIASTGTLAWSMDRWMTDARNAGVR